MGDAESVRRWRQMRRAGIRRVRADRWLEEQRNPQNEGLFQRLGRWFNNAMSEDGYAEERLRWEYRDRLREPRPEIPERPVPDDAVWWRRYPNLIEKGIGLGLGGLAGTATYNIFKAAAIAKKNGGWLPKSEPQPGNTFIPAPGPHPPALPPPGTNPPPPPPPMPGGGGGGSKRPRGDDDDDHMSVASGSAAGGSAVSVGMSRGGRVAHASGFGGLGIVGLVGNSNRSCPGPRNHVLLSHLDEHKTRGRKRAKDGVSRLFEAAEEWIPFRVQCLQSLDKIPQTTRTLTNAWNCYPIARSRCTYATVINVVLAATPTNCFSTSGNDYLRNGLFASVPAPAAVTGVTPGMRKTELPHIGKLVFNGSLSPTYYNGQAEGANTSYVKSNEVQLHLIKFSNAWTNANIQAGTVTSNVQKFVNILDASDFDLGVGSESYINGSITAGQISIAPAGTNVMVAQEQDMYPPRQNYKIVWSSPIITTNRAQEGNQTTDAASAGNPENLFYEPRIDFTNIAIPIDATISFNSGGTAELNTSATNRGDPFDCYHFVMTMKPHAPPSVFFGRDALSHALTVYGDTVAGSYSAAVYGQMAYMYNFRENS